MTAALENGEWSAARPGRTLTPGKTRYPFYRRLGWLQDRSGRGENLVPTGIRYRTVQPVAQSLYQLSYRTHVYSIYGRYKKRDNIGVLPAEMPSNFIYKRLPSKLSCVKFPFFVEFVKYMANYLYFLRASSRFARGSVTIRHPFVLEYSCQQIQRTIFHGAKQMYL